MWPATKQEEIGAKFLLFVTDSVAYMLKAGKGLKAMYPDLLHVTCVNHGLNRLSEEIRSCFPEVDRLVAALKSVFRKAPSRICLFKETCPQLPLPPQPVITRWGTWLAAVEYYSKNFDSVKSVVDKLNATDAVSIKNAQELMAGHKLKQDLAFLSANFTFLCGPLKDFQQQNATLWHSLEILAKVEERLASVKGDTGCRVREKYKAIFKRNPDWTRVKVISKIVNGDAVPEDELETANLKLSPGKIACFRYAPVTSVDAERSFSMLKAMLSERRRRMTPKTLEMSLVAHFEL